MFRPETERGLDTLANALNNQVFALMLEGDYDNAYRIARESLRKDPNHAPSRLNLATILKQLGREEEAIRILEALVRENPGYGLAVNNLAYSYIRRGDYKRGWPLYHQRLRSNAYSTHLPNNPATGLPIWTEQPQTIDKLVRKNIAIIPEQGIGDEMLFLRFQRRLWLRTDGQLWYAPSTKLYSVAKRIPWLTSTVKLTDFRFSDMPRKNVAAVVLGDLPLILGHDGSWFPRSMQIADDAIEPQRFEEPTLGVTWRAGTVEGTHRGHLFKMVDPRQLGAALSALPYKILVIQRGAEEQEMFDFAQGLGRPFDTWETPPGASTELLKVCAMLKGLTHYVGPSNTNTHLRAAMGLDQHVLIGLPGEWRWPITHMDSNPWFPQMKIYRKTMLDGWGPALAKLTEALQ